MALRSTPGLRGYSAEPESATQSLERRRIALACHEMGGQLMLAIESQFASLHSKMDDVIAEMTLQGKSVSDIDSKVEDLSLLMKSEAVGIAMDLQYDDVQKVKAALAQSDATCTQPEEETSPIKKQTLLQAVHEYVIHSSTSSDAGEVFDDDQFTVASNIADVADTECDSVPLATVLHLADDAILSSEVLTQQVDWEVWSLLGSAPLSQEAQTLFGAQAIVSSDSCVDPCQGMSLDAKMSQDIASPAVNTVDAFSLDWSTSPNVGGRTLSGSATHGVIPCSGTVDREPDMKCKTGGGHVRGKATRNTYAKSRLCRNGGRKGLCDCEWCEMNELI